MKIVVVKQFTDKHDKVLRKVGEELEVSEFRAGELVGRGYAVIETAENDSENATVDPEKKEIEPAKEKKERKSSKEKVEK